MPTPSGSKYVIESLIVLSKPGTETVIRAHERSAPQQHFSLPCVKPSGIARYVCRSTVHHIRHMVHSAPHTLRGAQCSTYVIWFTVHHIRYMVHSAPHTLHGAQWITYITWLCMYITYITVNHITLTVHHIRHMVHRVCTTYVKWFTACTPHTSHGSQRVHHIRHQRTNIF